MGVLEPVIESFVPGTPPALQDINLEIFKNVDITTDEDSEDDLYADSGTDNSNTFRSLGDLNFDDLIPVLPSKRDFEDLLEGENGHNKTKPWDIESPDANNNNGKNKKKKKFCVRCIEEVKKDLRKIVKIIEGYKKERDAAWIENEALKKEVEELKRTLKQKEEKEKSEVKIGFTQFDQSSVDVLFNEKSFKNSNSTPESSKTHEKEDTVVKYRVESVTVSLAQSPVSAGNNTALTDSEHKTDPKSKKTVADLRREFFAQEFQSEQKTFTAQNYLEIKQEEKKEMFKSQLNIRVKPKQRITQIISKLTSKIGRSKVIPEAMPMTMFQRFEKTREVWIGGVETVIHA